MAYQAKDYTALVGMEGFSEALLKNHFTLYNGYVTNSNKLLEILAAMLAEGKQSLPEYAELKRRFGWEFNGMRLHEYYFENLGGDGTLAPTSSLTPQLIAQFGSFEAWRKDFLATGAMRGIGWAILYQDPSDGKLVNCWITEHDGGHPAGGNPILVMDVFEHAFMLDYGTKRADYLEAFLRKVSWTAVEKRLK